MGHVVNSRVVVLAAILESTVGLITGCGSADSGPKPSSGGSTSSSNGGTAEEAGEPGSGGFIAAGGTTGVSGASGRGGASTGTGGRKSTGGGSGFGGSSAGFPGMNTGGISSGGSGGSSPASGGAPATGGTPGCITGVPCTCDDDLAGVTVCEDEESSCSCPPAKECKNETSPCFEPCGGDPFGAWVLEDTCLSGKMSGAGGCEVSVNGKPGKTDLRIRILDGGDFQVAGTESWDVESKVSLECLKINSVDRCEQANFWPESLLFSPSPLVNCTANACGVCDCNGSFSGVAGFGGIELWSREGNQLDLGNTRVDYCVDGDEMWIGGGSSDNLPRASYKFKKQSCTGKPTPCEERDADECLIGGDCSMGSCKPTTAPASRCALAFSSSECGVLQGCKWDPEGCAGTTAQNCEFEYCGSIPGCIWGPPKEKCGGYAASCGDRPLEACAGGGCSVRVCGPGSSDVGVCSLLNATECAKAPGCVVGTGATPCSGQTTCSAQTDVTICSRLDCYAQQYCGGNSVAACSTLSVAECQGVWGCRLEW